MCLSLLPVAAFAAEGDAYTLVTDVAELKAGDKVLIVADSAAKTLGVQQSNNFKEAGVTRVGNTVTFNDENVKVFTLENGTVDNTFAFKDDSTGSYLYAASSSSNQLKEQANIDGNASFEISITAGKTTIIARGSNTRNSIRYNSTSSLFACYSSGQEDVSLYKLQTGPVTQVSKPSASPAAGTYPEGTEIALSCSTEGAKIYYSIDGSAPSATSGTKYESPIGLTGNMTLKAIAVDPNGALTGSEVLEAEYTVLTKSTIAEARAATAGTKLMAEGVVTLIDGRNVYIEDSTGGINLYVNTAPSDSDLALGDTVVGIGQKGAFNGLPQLSGATYTKGAVGTLPLTETTIAAINAAETKDDLLCRRVKLTDLTWGVKNGDNTPLADADGNTINIYKCPTLEIVPGSTVTVTAVVSCHNSAMQLRVAGAGDVEVTAPPSKVATPTANPGGGNVAPGTEITFSCATLGAAIFYSTDDGTNWTESASYAVLEDAEVESAITIKVKATKENLVDSDEATFTYTVKDTPIGKWAKVTDTLNEGDQFIIYNKSNSEVMSDTADGSKLTGVSATPKGDYIQTAQGMSILTAEKGGEHFKFTNLDGKYLTSGATGNSLTFTDEANQYSLWDVEPITGGVRVLSVNAKYNGNTQALEYYSGFTVYGAASDEKFIFNLYVLTNEAPVFPVETPVITPADPSTDQDALTVVIACETAGASVYYTTDGTEPTASSTKYEAPFTITLNGGKVTVKAIAVKDGMANSAVATKEYTYFVPNGDFIPVANAGTLKAGGYFILVPKEYPGFAMSNFFAYKPGAVEVTLANGTYAPTLHIVPEGDGVAIQIGETEKYFGYKSSTSFEESTTAYKFNVTVNDNDGTFRLLPNTATNRAITYQHKEGGIGQFGPYAASNDGKTDQNGYGPYECDLLVYKSVNGYLYNPQVSFGVLNDAVPGRDYTTTYSFAETDAVSNVAAQYSADNETWTDAAVDTAAQTITVPGAAITAGIAKLYLRITATDTRGEKVTNMASTGEITVVDDPVISSFSPANGAETGADGLRPTIRVTVLNGGAFTAKITITPKTGDAITDAEMTVVGDAAAYTPDSDLAEGWCEASVTVTREDGKTVSKDWAFTVGKAVYQNYFGQLHSHTQYSDGSGTLAQALDYIKATAYRNNVAFTAFTDHSNYFDGAAGPKNADGAAGGAIPEAGLYDATLLTPAQLENWLGYKDAAAQFNEANAGEMVAIAGFEMTWSGGPGHINTFNTPGVVSRNNSALNNKTNDAGMRAYYTLLSNDKGEDSISQFNHPGTTFGTFSEFAYYDPTIDSRITLVEVGNGEGAIGSGGYFPSYSEYIKALDKGWHLAPTNNQDNHKGHWGDSNDARTVVYASDLSEQGIYQAMRDMSLYATEDKNLDIVYTVNGEILGSIIETVPASARFQAAISDPDGENIATVEIVTNGGAVVHRVDVNASSYELDWTSDAPAAGYYFLRVTEADKDVAVTAPVWLGAAKAVGMSELTTDTFMVVKDEAITITNQFFNNESAAATIKSLTYAIEGGATLKSTTPNDAIPSMGTLDKSYLWTPSTIGSQTVTLTAVVEVGGEEKTLKSSLTVDVKDPDSLIYIGVDGSHHNEYVSGNYKDSMNNFGTLAADYDVRVNVLNTSADLLAALANPKYGMMVFTAPTRRLALTDTWTAYDVYSEAELAAIAQFAQNGGTVVVAGWGDYYESYATCPKEPEMQMSAQQNAILNAIGSSLRVADDEAKDNDNKPGNNAPRLYLTDYNGFKSPLLAGVDPSQVWSQYGGSTIYAVDTNGQPTDALPDSVIPIVSGYGKYESDGSGVDLNKIDSYDEDGDGYMNGYPDKTVKPPKYQSDRGLTCLLTASETVTHANGTQSLVVVSGGAFMSNFEIKFEADNATQLGYSNPVALGNLVESLNPPTITKIGTVQTEGEEGQEFTVEGYITANTSGYDRDTAFFDCTYVQDETGGVNIFPVSDSFQVGQKVRVTGTIAYYQGEKELTVKSIKFLDRVPTTVTPVKVTAAQAASGDYLGQLIEVEGTVTSVVLVNGMVQTIRVRDNSGTEARIFIDGYITPAKDEALQQAVAVGAAIKAIGLASFDDTFNADGSESNRIRIRDRADITLVSSTPVTPPIIVVPSTPNTPTPADSAIQPDDVVETDTGIEVTIPDGEVEFSEEAQEKLAELNETQPVTLDGSVLKVIVPAGTLAEGVNPADLLVDPSQTGNAIRVTYPDGTSEIVPFALIADGTVAYIADKAGVYELVDNTKTFADVSSDSWAADAVDFVSANGLFNGTENGIFAPDGTMTRAMVVTVLARLGGVKVDDDAESFPDVPTGEWYSGAVAWAAEAGIVFGSNGVFDPDAPITREALCTIVSRFLKEIGYELDEVADAEGFADIDEVSDWARADVERALKTGLMLGEPGQIISPTSYITRAEVAIILQRLVKSVLG